MTSAEKISDHPHPEVTLLRTKDCLRSFSCGEREIDKWAKDKAHKFHERRRARVFCARSTTDGPTIGFYCLSLSTEQTSKISAEHRDAWSNGAPLIYIDYLAVAAPRQSSGIGTHLLVDALRKAYEVSKYVAPYGVALRSLNERTTKLYEKFGFGIAPDETGPSPLMILPIWSVIQLFEG
ncbi:GNAT family N-acetyltransferase [Ruegeria atlantica]|uniref:GNAT family N-acetyltransferase n=1 Tax=Ruegeria atlantica TaxID=81569 RepID=UPI003D7D190C